MNSFSKSVTRKGNENKVKSVNLKKNQHGMRNEVIKVRIPRVYGFGFIHYKRVETLVLKSPNKIFFMGFC